MQTVAQPLALLNAVDRAATVVARSIELADRTNV